MSIRSAISRSKNDLAPFDKKSYKNIVLGIEKVDLDWFLQDKDSFDMKKRIYMREYTVDHAKHVFHIFNKAEGLITMNQIRDIFDDLGFNSDATFSEVHHGDILLVYNIGGYLIPGWGFFAGKYAKSHPTWESFLLTKFAPGKKRLHCRLYHHEDGDWYLTAHVDEANWMNMINPFQMIKSHFVKGTGNYVEGVEIMEQVFAILEKRFEKKKRLFVNIEKIYRKVLAKE